MYGYPIFIGRVQRDNAFSDIAVIGPFRKLAPMLLVCVKLPSSVSDLTKRLQRNGAQIACNAVRS